MPTINTLLAVSSVDGRYEEKTAVLRESMSEFALFRARARVIVEFVIALSENPDTKIRALSESEKRFLRGKAAHLTLEDAETIKTIETTKTEFRGRRRTNHDVQAAILFITDLMKGTSLEDIISYVHRGRTSEDVNSLAYALMLRAAVRDAIVPSVRQVYGEIRRFAVEYAELPMLALTHGQPASPTTVGKEFAVFANRLERQIRELERFKMLVKFGGATGNLSADYAAEPDVYWPEFAFEFVARFNRETGMNFALNRVTTQIEPHDTFAELFAILLRINTILLGFSQDIWQYISREWLVQTATAGETGSSAMPNKVNPIDFENAEGNLGVANALFEFYCRKLPVSRFQRDLSDSTVIRTFGFTLGTCVIAYQALTRGLGKVSPNLKKIGDDLDAHPEVLAEAYQTVLRREGLVEGYKLLQELSRGKSITLRELHAFVDTLPIDGAVKLELKQLRPQSYVGIAAQLAKG